jgi:hypothetical protein
VSAYGLEPARRRLHGSLLQIADAVRGVSAGETMIEGEAVVFIYEGRSEAGARTLPMGLLAFLTRVLNFQRCADNGQGREILVIRKRDQLDLHGFLDGINHRSGRNVLRHARHLGLGVCDDRHGSTTP